MNVISLCNADSVIILREMEKDVVIIVAVNISDNPLFFIAFNFIELFVVVRNVLSHIVDEIDRPFAIFLRVVENLICMCRVKLNGFLYRPLQRHPEHCLTRIFARVEIRYGACNGLVISPPDFFSYDFSSLLRYYECYTPNCA